VVRRQPMGYKTPSTDVVATRRDPAPVPTSENPRPHPPRVMGFADLVLFYVVTGISLRWIATAASGGPSAIVIWIGAWLCFYVPLALSVLELSSRYPQEGGLYVWTKRAFGDFAGYIAAWTYWTSNLPYFPAVLYFAASNALYIRPKHWTYLSDNANFYVWFSVAALVLIAVMNLVGLNVGKWLHNLGAFGMWLPVMIIIAMGLIGWHRFGAATRFTAASLVPGTHLKDMVFWATLTFALGGCETASFMSEEVKNPRRTIPRALLLGGLIVTFCYILGTASVLLALPVNEVTGLQGLMQAVTRIAGRLGWFGVIPLAAALIAVSNLGAAGAFLAAVARLPFVAGMDRLLPSVFGKLHPRWGTPHVALLLQLFCGVLFVFLGQAGTSVRGAYNVLVSMGIITYFVPYLFLFAAMFRIQREKAGPEVICVPGGRPIAILVSCVGLITSLLTIALSVVPPAEEPNKVLATVKVVGLSAILVGVGAVLYYAAKRKNKNRRAGSSSGS
jgi:amino acid transporter